MMKTLLAMQQITLQISGREMTFSEGELVAILEKHLATQATQKQAAMPKPTEGKWFEVRPTEIDQRLFSEEKSDERQERTRQIILEAFAKMKHSPKYARPFKTLIPEKTWDERYASELKLIACKLGDHMADWVEQATEWAQRIHNGETWKAVCNDPDTANWHRLIAWKNGDTRFIGGSCKFGVFRPASGVHCDVVGDSFRLYDTVPLVVL